MNKTSAATRLLLLHGPNLNMLGRRDPEQYGTFTLADVEKKVIETASRLDMTIDCFQSNHEGALIDRIHESIDHCAGILINAGALTHTSYALRDALELTRLPVVEIHISDIYKREPFRRISVIHDVCIDHVIGLGLDGYRIAVEKMYQHVKGRS